jgi:hypothetical protein
MNSGKMRLLERAVLLGVFCVVLIYLAWGIASNYNAHHIRTLRNVSAGEAERNSYRIDLNRESGIKITLPRISHDNYLFLDLGPNDTYRIIFYRNGKKTSSFVVDSGPWAPILDGAGRKPVLHLIPAHISKEGYTSLAVFPIRGDGEYVVANIRTENFEEKPKGFYLSHNIIDFEIKQLELEIKEKSFEKIQKKRDDALKVGILLADDTDKVPAKIRADGKNYNGDVRLKGDLVDHLQTDKWSFRIELKGDFCIYGMQKFSIQAPETRVFLYERMIYEWYREQGGVALRYDFVDVFLNGEYKGVYALEEFMEKRVVEHSQKREGPIIKFDEDVFLWERDAIYEPKLKSPVEKTDKIFNELQVFSEKKTVMAEDLSGYAQYGIDQLNRLWAGISGGEILDLELFARLLVILDVFQARHGRVFHNNRYYYNPITTKLEPIPFDEHVEFYQRMSSFLLRNFDTRTYDVVLNSRNSSIAILLFLDPEFRNLYKKNAEKIFSEADSFLNSQREPLRQYETMLRRDMYGYSLATDFITENIAIIKNILNGNRTAPDVVLTKSGDLYNLSISNNDSAPVVITGLYDGSGNRLEIKEFPKTILAESDVISVRDSEWELSFPQPPGMDMDNLTLSFRYYFVEEEQHVPIFSLPDSLRVTVWESHLAEPFADTDLLYQDIASLFDDPEPETRPEGEAGHQ